MDIKLPYSVLKTAKKLIKQGATRERVARRIRKDMHAAVMKKPSLKQTLPYMTISDGAAISRIMSELRIVDPACKEYAGWQKYSDTMRYERRKKRHKARLESDPEYAADYRAKCKVRDAKYYDSDKGKAFRDKRHRDKQAQYDADPALWAAQQERSQAYYYGVLKERRQAERAKAKAAAAKP